MTTAADITDMNTKIGLVTDAATSKTALQAVAVVAGDLNTSVNASLAQLAAVNGGGPVAITKLAQTNQEQGLEILAGSPSSYPAGELTVPAKVIVGASYGPLDYTTGKTLTGATRSVAYSSATLAAAGGSGSGITHAIVAGALPTGLSLNASTGAITGTTTAAAGTYQFVATATDDAGNKGSKLFVLVLS